MDSITLNNKKYLKEKVNPILELMVADIMKIRPEKPLKFI